MLRWVWKVIDMQSKEFILFCWFEVIFDFCCCCCCKISRRVHQTIMFKREMFQIEIRVYLPIMKIAIFSLRQKSKMLTFVC